MNNGDYDDGDGDDDGDENDGADDGEEEEGMEVMAMVVMRALHMSMVTC